MAPSFKFINGDYRAAYTYGLERIGVEDLMEVEGKPNNPLYYLQDALGSITAITNMNGGIIDSNRFAPYGEPLDPVAKNARLTNSPYGFTGEMHDIEGRLLYLRARYYSPDMMRFIQQDTMFGEIKEPLSRNLYIYGNGNPLKCVDPSGHMAVLALRGISCLYNTGILNAELTSILTLVANGFGVYTAFHEIAQLNIAKKLNKMGYKSILEFPIKSKTEKNWLGKNKTYEADVVSGNMVWEVKPLGTSGTAQLTKYMTNGNLIAGFTMAPITNIPVFGEYKMGIVFNRPGEANYYFYRLNEKGEQVRVPSAVVKKEYSRRAAGAMVVAGAIIAATLVEDAITAGAGAVDDIPSLIGALEAAGAILAH